MFHLFKFTWKMACNRDNDNIVNDYCCSYVSVTSFAYACHGYAFALLTVQLKALKT